MWCPQCRSEYRDGITVCNDCGVPLVKTLPVEIDPSPAQHQARALDRADSLEQLRRCEKENSRNPDEVSGYFGRIMEEVFVWRKDEWEADLRRMGFFLGKFIYLMDAYEDVEKDRKTGNYNLFLQELETEGFERRAEAVLSMMMAECSRAFERLPIVENTEILRNILYSGVWCRYEYVKKNRERKVTDV